MKFTKRNLTPKSEGGGSNFIRLKDGDSVTGVLRGEMREFYQLWPFGGDKQVSDKPFKGASVRFSANLVIKEGDQFVAKLFEFGAVIYDQLADIAEEYEIEETKVKITRRGDKKETTYMVLPLLKEPLSPSILAQIKAVDLIKLLPKEPEHVGQQKTGTDDEFDF